MATKTINVIKPFTLTTIHEKELKKVFFAPGIQDVDAEHADHWYTQAHCAELPKQLKAKSDKA